MIGQTLIAQGAITSAQLERALGEQRVRGGLVGEVLLSLAFVTEESLGRALAAEAGVPFRGTEQLRSDPSAVALVPETLARHYLVAPLAVANGSLRVAQANPFDVLAVDELQRLTGRPIDVEGAARSDVIRLIDRSYRAPSDIGSLADIAPAPSPIVIPPPIVVPPPVAAPAVSAPPVVVPPPAEAPAAIAAAEPEPPADDPSVAMLIDALLRETLACGATGLHLDPETAETRVRRRIDGVLVAGESLPRESHADLVRRLKTMAGLAVAETHLPQEGRAAHLVGGRSIDLRIATFPTMDGEQVAIRVLQRETVARTIDELGISKRNLQTLKDLLNRRHGAILVAGPPDSGKTATLGASAAFLGAHEKNVFTIEDAIESTLPGVRQTAIRPDAGFTYAAALRSVLHQDPDAVVIGAIDDAESAALALRAAASNVLIVGALDAPDAASAIARLCDLGVETHLVVSGVAAVVAQRLVRTVCPDCREAATYPRDTMRKLGLGVDPGVTLFRGRGCDRCGGTGYRGRTCASEVLVVDAAIHHLVRERADARLIKAAAARAGMKTLPDDALAKALFGTTTLEEVQRAVCE